MRILYRFPVSGKFYIARSHPRYMPRAPVPSRRVNLISGIWQIPFKNSVVNPTEAACARRLV